MREFDDANAHAHTYSLAGYLVGRSGREPRAIIHSLLLTLFVPPFPGSLISFNSFARSFGCLMLFALSIPSRPFLPSFSAFLLAFSPYTPSRVCCHLWSISVSCSLVLLALFCSLRARPRRASPR